MLVIRGAWMSQTNTGIARLRRYFVTMNCPNVTVP